MRNHFCCGTVGQDKHHDLQGDFAVRTAFGKQERGLLGGKASDLRLVTKASRDVFDRAAQRNSLRSYRAARRQRSRCAAVCRWLQSQGLHTRSFCAKGQNSVRGTRARGFSILRSTWRSILFLRRLRSRLAQRAARRSSLPQGTGFGLLMASVGTRAAGTQLPFPG